jgi:hypothetical protein
MKRFTHALAALSLAAAASPAFAITFGQPDGNAHPFVGTILFERPDGYYSCTGTMLSPTVMLTAGHCTEEFGVANSRSWVKFTPDIVVHSGCAGDHACLNKYLDNAKNGWISGTAVPHPNYDDFAGWPSAPTYDVGIIKLSKPVSMSTYGVLPPLGFLETIRNAKDNSFTAVGYGLQGYIAPFYSDAWTRYAGTVSLLEVNSTWTGGGTTAKYTNNPGTGGGTCFGDSGGPIFYGNTNMFVSIVSWGQTPCIGVDFNFRTDIPTTQDFVGSFF